uniref:Leuk-A4-hydro_C domain-containing protein n=1 Tax=Angiostrongylus cantonensis TaxID=6313 RepID=A0A0K0DLG1_ANGCA
MCYRYDLVVLPPTFPFGGMENPCLTFVTPTLLAGDRSLVTVVAHEIAHSWTGNLITNASWEHFWLNEGFTVFLERKILGRLKGELERQFQSEYGFDVGLSCFCLFQECLKTAVKTFGDSHEFTKLIPDLRGADPDDAFSSVPYEKGSAFLFTIEQLLGDTVRFENFLRAYIDKYAFQSVTTKIWKDELYSFFSEKKAVLDKIDWNTWLFAPGMPPKPKYDSRLMEVCCALAAEWISAPENNLPVSSSSFENMSPMQKVTTLAKIRTSGKFAAEKMSALTSHFNLEQTKNCEVRFAWLMLGLETKWMPIVPKALSFVLTVGRMKFCKPIYRYRIKSIDGTRAFHVALV